MTSSTWRSVGARFLALLLAAVLLSPSAIGAESAIISDAVGVDGAGNIKNARLPDPYIVDYVRMYDRPGTFVLSCRQNNDLYTLLKNNEIPCTRCDTPEAAVDAAPEGGAVFHGAAPRRLFDVRHPHKN